jgi:hypothetical protein
MKFFAVGVNEAISVIYHECGLLRLILKLAAPSVMTMPSPITLGGRVFTGFVLIAGLGIVAVPTSLVAVALAKDHEHEKEVAVSIICTHLLAA